MSVRVTVEITNVEYRLLARLCEARGVTLPVLTQQMLGQLAGQVESGIVLTVRPKPAPPPPAPKAEPNTRGYRITPEQVEEIRSMHEAGSTGTAIAAELGISVQSVYNWVNKLKLPHHPTGRRPKE